MRAHGTRTPFRAAFTAVHVYGIKAKWIGLAIQSWAALDDWDNVRTCRMTINVHPYLKPTGSVAGHPYHMEGPRLGTVDAPLPYPEGAPYPPTHYSTVVAQNGQHSYSNAPIYDIAMGDAVPLLGRRHTKVDWQLVRQQEELWTVEYYLIDQDVDQNLRCGAPPQGSAHRVPVGWVLAPRRNGIQRKAGSGLPYVYISWSDLDYVMYQTKGQPASLLLEQKLHREVTHRLRQKADGDKPGNITAWQTEIVGLALTANAGDVARTKTLISNNARSGVRALDRVMAKAVEGTGYLTQTFSAWFGPFLYRAFLMSSLISMLAFTYFSYREIDDPSATNLTSAIFLATGTGLALFGTVFAYSREYLPYMKAPIVHGRNHQPG
jgi:hypothetical protein